MQKIKPPPFSWEHASPLTRRRFLKYGALSAFGYLMPPTWWAAIMRERAARAGSSVTVLVEIALKGGPNLLGRHFAAMGPDGATQLTNTVLGLTSSQLGKFDTTMKGAPMVADSPLLAGLKSTASNAVLSTTGTVVFPGNSLSDSGSYSTFSISGTAATFATTSLGGAAFSSPLGTALGGQIVTSAKTPIAIKSISDLSTMFQSKTVRPSLLNNLVQRSLDMTSAEAGDFVNQVNGNTLSASVIGGLKANQLALAQNSGFDPRTDTRVSVPFGLTATTDPSDPKAVMAAGLRTMLIGGLTVPVYSIVMEGADYHTGKAADGIAFSQNLGATIGSILTTCRNFGVSVMIAMWGDGGISAGSTPISGETDLPYTGDNNATTAIAYMYSSPNGFTMPLGNGTALNFPNPSLGGLADSKSAFSQAPNSQMAALINWANLNGISMSTVASTLPYQFTPSDISNALHFVTT
jgi:hypothetical protein